jgi:DNA-nicking Smr family endonuclease
MREKLQNLELTAMGADEAERSRVARGYAGRLVENMANASRHDRTSPAFQIPDSKFQTSELNLIGKTTDEAVDLADKFLDAAFLNGLSEVRIIHGHGTGALRKAVTEFLSDHPIRNLRGSLSPARNKGGQRSATSRTVESMIRDS